MRGWERVTLSDVARLTRQPTPPDGAKKSSRKPQKFHAEPCIVTSDGTLFTTADIVAVELTTADSYVGPHGTLKERAARCGIHGRWFASLKEGRRYLELRALAQECLIYDLRCQVAFDLTVVSKVDSTETVIGIYRADFVYRRAGETQDVVEDVKSKGTSATEAYRRTRKHFTAQYGLSILET